MAIKIFGRDQQRQRKVYSQYRNPVDVRQRARRTYGHVHREPRFLRPPLADAPVIITVDSVSTAPFFNTATNEYDDAGDLTLDHGEIEGFVFDHTGKRTGLKNTYFAIGYTSNSPWRRTGNGTFLTPIDFKSGYAMSPVIYGGPGKNFIAGGAFDNDGYYWNCDGGNGTQTPAWTIVDPANPENPLVERIWKNTTNWNVRFAWPNKIWFRSGPNSIFFSNSSNQLLRFACRERYAEVFLTLAYDLAFMEWVDATRSYRGRDTIYTVGGARLDEWDAETKQLIKTVNVQPDLIPAASGPDGLTYDFKNHQLYIGYHFSKNLTKINAKDFSLSNEFRFTAYGQSATTLGRFNGVCKFQPETTGTFGTISDRIWYQYFDEDPGTSSFFSRLVGRSTNPNDDDKIIHTSTSSLLNNRNINSENLSFIWQDAPELGIPGLQTLMDRRTDNTILRDADPKDVVWSERLYKLNMLASGSGIYSGSGNWPPLVLAHFRASGSQNFNGRTFTYNQQNLLSPVSGSPGLFYVDRISDLSNNNNHLFPFEGNDQYRCYWTASFQPFNDQPAFIFRAEDESHMVSSGSSLNYQNSLFEQGINSEYTTSSSYSQGHNFNVYGCFHYDSDDFPNTSLVTTLGQISASHGFLDKHPGGETGWIVGTRGFLSFNNEVSLELMLFNSGSLIDYGGKLDASGTTCMRVNKAGGSGGLNFFVDSLDGTNSGGEFVWLGPVNDANSSRILITHTGSFEMGKVGTNKHTSFAFSELLITRVWLQRPVEVHLLNQFKARYS